MLALYEDVARLDLVATPVLPGRGRCWKEDIGTHEIHKLFIKFLHFIDP